MLKAKFSEPLMGEMGDRAGEQVHRGKGFVDKRELNLL